MLFAAQNYLFKLFFAFCLAITSENLFAQERVNKLVTMTQNDLGEAVKSYVQTFQKEYGLLFWPYNKSGIKISVPYHDKHQEILLQNGETIYLSLTYYVDGKPNSLSKPFILLCEEDFGYLYKEERIESFNSQNFDTWKQCVKDLLTFFTAQKTLFKRDAFEIVLNEPEVCKRKPLIIFVKKDEKCNPGKACDINMMLSVVGSFIINSVEEDNEPFTSKIYGFFCNHKTEFCFASVFLVWLIVYLKYKK